MDISKTDFPFIDIIFSDLTPRVSCESRAIRSLKIAEFDQRNRGIGITLEVPDLRE